MAQTPNPTPTAASRRERNALGAQPWHAIPSGDLTGNASHYSEVRPLEIQTATEGIVTCCSLRFFSFIGAAAAQEQPVTAWHFDDYRIGHNSLDRLNSYLRTASLETMALPWHATSPGPFHRYAFAGFCEHLALDFLHDPTPNNADGAGETLDGVALETMTPEQIEHVSIGVEHSFGAQIINDAPAFFIRLDDKRVIRLPTGITARDIFNLAKILSV